MLWCGCIVSTTPVFFCQPLFICGVIHSLYCLLLMFFPSLLFLCHCSLCRSHSTVSCLWLFDERLLACAHESTISSYCSAGSSKCHSLSCFTASLMKLFIRWFLDCARESAIRLHFSAGLSRYHMILIGRRSFYVVVIISPLLSEILTLWLPSSMVK